MYQNKTEPNLFIEWGKEYYSFIVERGEVLSEMYVYMIANQSIYKKRPIDSWKTLVIFEKKPINKKAFTSFTQKWKI